MAKEAKSQGGVLGVQLCLEGNMIDPMPDTLPRRSAPVPQAAASDPSSKRGGAPPPDKTGAAEIHLQAPRMPSNRSGHRHPAVSEGARDYQHGDTSAEAAAR